MNQGETQTKGPKKKQIDDNVTLATIVEGDQKAPFSIALNTKV